MILPDLDPELVGAAVFGLPILLGVWAGLREWRRHKNRPRPAPRFVLELLGYGALFTGVLWTVVVLFWPDACNGGTRLSWVFVAVAALSCLPGSLVAMLVCRAHRNRPDRRTWTEDTPSAGDGE